MRFDTWFFVAAAPDGAQARVDGGEVVDAIWLTPQTALERQEQGSLLLVFPTIKQLHQLSGFNSAARLLAHAGDHSVEPVQHGLSVRAKRPGSSCPGTPATSERQAFSSSLITCRTALISARCVKAWG